MPGPEDLSIDDQLSGVPWGGPSLRFMVAKGHESLGSGSGSRHSSGSQRGSQYYDDTASAYAYQRGSVTSSAAVAVTAAVTSADAMADFVASAPSEPYYYVTDDGTQVYPYGSDAVGVGHRSSRSSSDYTQETISQDKSSYDNASYFYDYNA